MVVVTISLSNSNQPKQVLQGRKIEIKQIKQRNVEEKVPPQTLSNEEESNLIEHEITELQEELKSLQTKKETMLDKVYDDIKGAKENWEKEKEVLIEETKRVGYESGFKQGEIDSKKANEALYTETNKIVLAAKEDYYHTLDQSDETIVELAINTAEKIINQKINDKPESFLDIVEEAIQEIKDQSVITIYLHPKNYQQVLKQKKELIASVDGSITISIYTDKNLSENDCHIEHPLGKVDVSVDTQLTQIRKTLIEFVKEHKS